MAPDDRSDLTAAQRRAQSEAAARAAIVVCHSMPPNFAVPEPLYRAGEQCPPDPTSECAVKS